MADAQEGNEYAINAVKKAPKLLFPLYWTAFNDLSTERQVGMGLGPIPIRATDWYAGRLMLTERETEAFVSIIRNVDVYYLNKVAARTAKSK
jgi:hypothetical protein